MFFLARDIHATMRLLFKLEQPTREVRDYFSSLPRASHRSNLQVSDMILTLEEQTRIFNLLPDLVLRLLIDSNSLLKERFEKDAPKAPRHSTKRIEYFMLKMLDENASSIKGVANNIRELIGSFLHYISHFVDVLFNFNFRE